MDPIVQLDFFFKVIDTKIYPFPAVAVLKFHKSGNELPYKNWTIIVSALNRFYTYCSTL